MMLWDIIRDWFVMYVFGGYTSNYDHEYTTGLGGFLSYDGSVVTDEDFGYLTSLFFKVGNEPGNEIYISFADWLSTTATLIVMISICVGLFFLVRYFFRMFAGLLSGR